MEYPKIETLYERNESFKVDPAKLKNRVYGIIKSWHFTEKIDGTNIRIVWDAANKTLQILGRTANANLSADLLNYLHGLVTVEMMEAKFSQTSVILYGEGYGAGIQKGGDLSATKKFILFDVLVDGKWWMNWENTCDIAAALRLDVVPYFGEMTLEEATALVRGGFQSQLNGGKAKAEGLVGRTVEPLFDKKGSRLIVKLKTKDF